MAVGSQNYVASNSAQLPSDITDLQSCLLKDFWQETVLMNLLLDVTLKQLTRACSVGGKNPAILYRGFINSHVLGKISCPAARTILPAWFDHLAERFLCKEVQFKQFCRAFLTRRKMIHNKIRNFSFHMQNRWGKKSKERVHVHCNC